jgi:hypothetical protein
MNTQIVVNKNTGQLGTYNSYNQKIYGVDRKPIDSTEGFERIRLTKPEGYRNSYENYYAEGGIFWPLPKMEIVYKGTHIFWFTNIMKDAENLLEKGKTYHIKSIEPASSWCPVILEEFPDVTFSLGFFEEKEPIKKLEDVLKYGCELVSDSLHDNCFLQ